MEIKNIFNHKKYNLVLGIISYVILVVSLYLEQGLIYKFSYEFGAEFKSVDTIVINICIIMAITSMVYLCVSRISYSILVSNIILVTFFLVNQLVVDARELSININDFTVAMTAFSVSSKYKLIIHSGIIAAIILSIIEIIAIFILDKNKAKVKRKYTLVVILVALMPLTMYNSNNLIEKGIKPIEYREINYGTLANIYISSKFNTINIPDNYTEDFVISDKVDESDIKITEYNGYDLYYSMDFIDSLKDKPDNVVFILAESLQDDYYLKDYGYTSEEVIPNIYNMMISGEYITGYTVSSTFCGGTANSEYEVLTGGTLGLFDTTIYPFQTLLKSKTSSIVQNFNSSGYDTLALHNYRKSGYNRINAFEYLGFNQFIGDNNNYFENADTIGGYIRDKEGFEYIIDRLNNTDDKTFTYYITMQCHGNYYNSLTNEEREKYNTKVFDFGQPDNDSYDLRNLLANYAEVLNDFDKSYKWFIDEISKLDEKTLVIMYGDHTEILSNSIKDNLGGYLTPFVVYSNYDLGVSIPDNKKLLIGQTYFGELIIKLSGVGETSKDKYIQEAYEVMPVYEIGNYIYSTGDYFSDKQELSNKTIGNVLNSIGYDCLINKNKQYLWDIK